VRVSLSDPDDHVRQQGEHGEGEDQHEGNGAAPPAELFAQTADQEDQNQYEAEQVQKNVEMSEGNAFQGDTSFLNRHMYGLILPHFLPNVKGFGGICPYGAAEDFGGLESLQIFPCL
jgi:hypothetical protein